MKVIESSTCSERTRRGFLKISDFFVQSVRSFYQSPSPAYGCLHRGARNHNFR